MSPTELLASGVSLIDLRAPVEFAQGAFPTAVNLPLLNDGERHEVGLIYKNQGREAAVAKGHELVSGAVRRQRMRAWTAFIEQRPDAWLYCWRGGLRSRIAGAWLQEAGFTLPSVAGGYKCLRHTCLATLERAAADGRLWLVVAGRTGSGKTRVINRLDNAIDLEGAAHHRGSAFGALPGGQPTPVAFENALAVAYLKHAGSTLVLEDESRTIGRLALPEPWFKRMREAPLVLLEAPRSERVRNIRGEYIDQPLAAGLPAAELQVRLRASLDRIGKRLGGDRHRQVCAALDGAFRSGAHESWIEQLLEWYYDPMYDYQLRSKQERVIFSGKRPSVLEYLRCR